MAPSVLSPVPSTFASPFSPKVPRRTSGFAESDAGSNYGMSRSITSRRVSSRRIDPQDIEFSRKLSLLQRQGGDELGMVMSGNTLDMVLSWIHDERSIIVPPEGSSYDKVLGWAQLFISRLQRFEEAIHGFTNVSEFAFQMAYGYCLVLLKLGDVNASALMTSFGFFYSTSTTLGNLLERTELFSVTNEIQRQLVQALEDLVNLVANVSSLFHQTVSRLGEDEEWEYINIYEKFPTEIHRFRKCCEEISESMWQQQLKEIGDETKLGDVKAVRSWLTPEDRVLSNVAETVSHLAHDREEMTCRWVKPYLFDFLTSQKKVLSIVGKPGSGKTVLASVIVDSLQHPIRDVHYKTLFIPINARLPAGTTPRAITKAVLSQLFEKRIGNVQLLQILTDSLQRSQKATNDNDYDNILWNALERALVAALQNAKELVIVVDGVDEASCGESVLLQKLSAATTAGTNVKLIALGAQKPTPAPGHVVLSVTDERIFEDIATVVRSQFLENKESVVFPELDDFDQEPIIERITEASKGSFLWAKLACKRVRVEDSLENIHKTLDAIISNKTTVADFVLQTVQQKGVTDEARLMLLWLATADRPLMVKEIQTLSSIQVDKLTITEGHHADPLRVLRPVNSLVYVQDGQVYLRHGLVRSAVLEVFSKGKLVPTIKDRHADFVTRLLIYIKSNVTEPQGKEPSIAPLNGYETDSLLSRYPLLDFAIRYWVSHLRQTTIFSSQGEVAAAKEFGKVFPASITVLLLQRTVWANRPTPELLTLQTTISTLYRQLLTPNNRVTLQSIINLALFYRDVEYFPESIPLLFEATTLSRTLLSTSPSFTAQLATFFLDLTVTRTTETKTEIMTKREETLLLLVDCYTKLYGETHKTVITTREQLVKHYQTIKEFQKAEEIVRHIKIITTGEQSSESREFHGDWGVRVRGQHRKVIRTRINDFLEAEEHDELIERSELFEFESLMKRAEQYTGEGKFELAERTYVEIWQHVSRECRANYSSLWEERKMLSVLAYSKFLKTQKREYEASSILSSVWQEYEQTIMSASETSVAYFQEIAKVMKTVNLSTLALTVFKRCSEYYKSTNRTQTSSYKEVQESIQTTSKEVMQSFSSSTSVTSETTLEEMVYEASTSITTIDQTSFAATSSLIGLYVEQHRWQDATRVIKKVLHGVWPTLFAPTLQDVTLPEKHVENCIQLAERLSRCYYARRRVTKEEDIRVRIYHALRSERKVDDKLRERITDELLRLFERTSQDDKIINLHQELLNDYTKHYGPEHAVVIKTLWTLAKLTRPRPIFVDYYLQIVRTLNKESPTCHPEAFEPLVIVATELWNQGRYSDAVHYYKIIFTTFLSQPKQSPKLQNQTFVQEIFTRYTHCLRSVRTEFSVLHQVTVEYHKTVKTVFSATASISLQATLTLAKLCQESKRYELQAITLYEELLKTKSEELDLHEISGTLEAIYEEQAAIVTSTKSETVSSTQIERAVKVLRSRINTVRETHGWAHEESLSKMQQMISFYTERKETDTVVQELKQATVQILSSETSSTRLIAAASTIASSYIASNQITKATELTQEIYRQIVMKDTTNSKSVQFDLSSKERQSLTFLAQLEYSLRRSSSTTITEILAALTTEYVYFEEFRGQLKSKTSSIHSVSVSTARLYRFLVTNNRQTAATRVFDDFVNYFIATEGKRVKLTQTGQVRIFAETILHHFSTHRSDDFVRSIGITSNEYVGQLLKSQRWGSACDLALASFHYIKAHQEVYRTVGIVKFIFNLGMNIAGRDLVARPDEASRKRMIEVSGTILKDSLTVIKGLKLDMSGVNFEQLSKLIGLLGEQGDYVNLAWILTALWDSREAHRNWPHYTLALGHRLVIARFRIGKQKDALRLAEDIAYNCRRVHGAQHPSTLEMSVLLTQLYTKFATSQQAHKELANRYYKKSAAVHEGILRAFCDPGYADFEGGLEASLSQDGSVYEVETRASANGGFSEGDQVRQHLQLFKLAVERLGEWPGDYEDYNRLNASVFKEFPKSLEGVEGVEKWNLKAFGSGKAESNDDVLNLDLQSWDILDTHPSAVEAEEEL
ncbi:NACHT domain protein [Aspergillus heteromorphus CBS 117.55]|uniref:NACHT domain protein n=1 Tax=Aspergillus heteromorphus CBS 117.55 TaxID=1448321 RepID=A0A317VP26_9EURO|nr:NACHT domain protein [Aspergillus heteromorphus CBS 117.55]PWY75001.1 NACHT domain protein [Aspergillus heteromorphus CBS 117.55]